LTGRPLCGASDPIALIRQITEEPFLKPSEVAAEVPHKWDGIVLRGLERSVAKRWKTAMAMADAIEAIGGLAQQREVGNWVMRLGADRLAKLTVQVKALEMQPVRRSAARNRVDPRSQLRIDQAAVKRAMEEAERLAALSEAEVDSLAARPAAAEGPGAPPPASEPPAAAPKAEEAPPIAALAERAQGAAPPVAPPTATEAAPVNGERSSSAAARAPRRSLTAVASSVDESGRGRRGRFWLGVAAIGLLAAVGLVWGLSSRQEPSESSSESAGDRDLASAPSGADAGPQRAAPSTTTTTEEATAASTSASSSSSSTLSSSAVAPASAKSTGTRTFTKPGGLYSRD
jgi:hypothetical protein